MRLRFTSFLHCRDLAIVLLQLETPRPSVHVSQRTLHMLCGRGGTPCRLASCPRDRRPRGRTLRSGPHPPERAARSAQNHVSLAGWLHTILAVEPGGKPSPPSPLSSDRRFSSMRRGQIRSPCSCPNGRLFEQAGIWYNCNKSWCMRFWGLRTCHGAMPARTITVLGRMLRRMIKLSLCLSDRPHETLLRT